MTFEENAQIFQDKWTNNAPRACIVHIILPLPNMTFEENAQIFHIFHIADVYNRKLINNNKHHDV